MDNYLVDAETGCWIWQGYRDASGYTSNLVDGKYVSARRWHYQKRFGPIPDDVRLALECGNALCVNAEHMAALTPREIGRRRPSNKLDEGKVQEIRALAGQLTQREIAERFGISESHVNQIFRGKSWRVEDADPTPASYEHRVGKLSFAEAERIRELAQTTPRKELMGMFGVSESTISLILSGKRWAKPHRSSVARSDATAELPTS